MSENISSSYKGEIYHAELFQKGNNAAIVRVEPPIHLSTELVLTGTNDESFLRATLTPLLTTEEASVLRLTGESTEDVWLSKVRTETAYNHVLVGVVSLLDNVAKKGDMSALHDALIKR